MSDLRIRELPLLRQPAILAAFSGWPDAGEVGSRAIRYLRRSLRSRKFAEIDPQPFYDFTRVRPISRIIGPGVRDLSWPSCDFSFWRTEGPRDLVLFLAPEPQLQWQKFSEAVLELAERVDARILVVMGGTYDSVAHTRPPVITGHATEVVLRQRLQRLGVTFSDYEGPSSIHSAVIQLAQARSLPSVSLWGHAPHYVTTMPNPRVSLGLLTKAAQLLGFAWDLSDLQQSAEEFTRRVDEDVAQKPELRDYVRRLEGPPLREPTEEQRPDEPPGTGAELPPAEAVVQDLEEFLRRLRQDNQPGS